MHGRTWPCVLLMLSMVACDRNRTSVPTSPSPTSSSEVRLMTLRISGPTSVAPGSTTQYRAIAEYSDGSTRDVTEEASWGPNEKWDFPIYFTSAGIAAAVKYGELVIGAKYYSTLMSNGSAGWMNSALRVFVLDPGTFRLGGTVVNTRGGVIAGATVEVQSGTGKGLKATTDFEGGYAVYGVAGPVRLRTSAEGFPEDVREVNVTQNDVVRVALTPLQDPVDVSGDWTLTVTPASGCPAGLPDVARNRTYEMHLTQEGMDLHWTLDRETLEYGTARSYTYGDTVIGSRVRLFFVGDTGYEDYVSPSIIDVLSPTEWFGFSGLVTATLSNSEIRGTLNGSLVYWTRAPAVWSCTRSDHIVTLRR
jgi:hypothetical protein